MEAVVAGLADLVKEQGRQIVELSKALAIAHEHHVAPVASSVSIPPFADFADSPEKLWSTPDKLWLTEDEEEAEFNRTRGTGEHLAKETHDAIFREAGIDPSTITIHST